MFNKKKQFRRKVGNVSDDEEDGYEGEDQLGPGIKVGSGTGETQPKAKPKPKPPVTSTSTVATSAKPKPSSLLSFGGEEEEEEDGSLVLQKSKKAEAKKKKKAGGGLGRSQAAIEKDKKKDAASLGPSNIVPQTGEYTKERLAELQKSTPMLATPRKSSGAKGDSRALNPPPPLSAPPSEPVIILKGLLKPTSDPRSLTKPAGGTAASITSSMQSLGLPGTGAAQTQGGGVVIPDARAIAAAKAKRERMRQADSAPEFIPVPGGGRAGGGTRGGEREGEEGGRKGEEGESSEDEEEAMTGRMAFVGLVDGGVKTRGKQGAGKKGTDGTKGVLETGKGEEAGEQDEEGEGEMDRDEEEEEEAKRWEEEQLRKGVGKAAAAATLKPANEGKKSSTDAGAPLSEVLGSAAELDSQQRGPVVVMPAGSAWGYGHHAALPAAEDGASVMKFLHEGLARLQDSHSQSQHAVHHAELSLSRSAESVIKLEQAMDKAERKYAFVQELRHYVAVLADLLQDKSALIEELEEHMRTVQEDRAGATAERRRKDDEDELAQAEAATSAAMSALARGAGTVSAAEAAVAAVMDLEEEGGEGRKEYDEFGRDVNLQKRLDAKRRQERRYRRRLAARQRRETPSSASTGTPQPDWNGHTGGATRGELEGEGECSSGESEGEASGYETQRREVLATADAIFSDAAEEYSSLDAVKRKLEEWKRAYPGSYRDAYASLSVPSLFTPFVRLEMLKWDPLYVGGGFDHMQWYNSLFDYGLPPSGSAPDPDDADPNLVPRLVELVAQPILLHQVAQCWDPLSGGGTARLVSAVEECLIYVEASSPAMQELLETVQGIMRGAIEQAEVPAWAPPVLSACPSAAQFASLRFGRSVWLMRNLLQWRAILATPVLERLVLKDLFEEKVLPHLRLLLPLAELAVARLERVVGVLAEAWQGDGPLGQGSDKSSLQGIVNYLDLLGRSLEGKLKGGGSQENVLELASRVKRMWMKLDENDRAQEIAMRFGLKE